MEKPVDVVALHHRIRGMIEDAETFIAKLPSDAVGVVFMEGDKPVQPDADALGRYQRNPGAPCGYLAVAAGYTAGHARTPGHVEIRSRAAVDTTRE